MLDEVDFFSSGGKRVGFPTALYLETVCLTRWHICPVIHLFSPPRKKNWRSHVSLFVLKYKLLKLMSRSSTRVIVVIHWVNSNSSLALPNSVHNALDEMEKSVLLVPKSRCWDHPWPSQCQKESCARVFCLLVLWLPKEVFSGMLGGSTPWACNDVHPKVPPYTHSRTQTVLWEYWGFSWHYINTSKQFMDQT